MKTEKKQKRKNPSGGSRDVRHQVLLRHSLRWRLTLFVFSITLGSAILTFLLLIALLRLGKFAPWLLRITLNPVSLCLLLLAVCSIFGVALAGVFGKYYLRPLKALIRGTEEIKKGNFKVKVDGMGDERSEMGQLINSFNEMAHELDGIELFRNDFINNFSHEFKTPIVSSRGFAREIEHGKLDAERQREYVHIIVEEADRLSKLSTNVLELSKLENQQLVTDRTQFYLDEQLRQSILLQETAWESKSIEMIPELEEVLFFGNEELLSHVWNNLIANAIKFTPENGTVTVRLRATEQEIVVQVIDTGIGMSAEVQSHVFERFYQGDPSHHSSGHGIGLTLAHRAATLSGGTITVESTPGNGSTFTVRLPR